MKKEKKYYVYVYLDPRKSGKYVYKTEYGKLKLDYEPIYVGKGSNNRYKVHLNLNRCGNSRLRGKIKNIRKEGLGNPIIKSKRNLSENNAYELEEELVEIIGRADWKTGPLANSDAGGRGRKNHKVSKKTRRKLSKAHKIICQNPEVRKRMSEKTKEIWKRPGYKEKLCVSLKKSWDNSDKERRKWLSILLSERNIENWEDPKYRKKMLFFLSDRKEEMRKVSKKNWKDPEYRKRMINMLKDQWKDPEYRKNMTNMFKDQWEDPEYRRNMSKIRKEMWEDPKYRKKIMKKRKDPKIRKRISESVKKLWQDLEYRKRMSEGHKKENKKEISLQRSLRMKEFWNKPGQKERMGQKSRNRWKNPEYKKNISEKIRKNWIKQNEEKIKIGELRCPIQT